MLMITSLSFISTACVLLCSTSIKSGNADLPDIETALENITIYNNTTVDDMRATTVRPVLI